MRATDDVTDIEIMALIASAGQAGDIVQAAIGARAIGVDFSCYALDEGERSRVEAMSAEEARAICADAVADAANQE